MNFRWINEDSATEIAQRVILFFLLICFWPQGRLLVAVVMGWMVATAIIGIAVLVFLKWGFRRGK